MINIEGVRLPYWFFKIPLCNTYALPVLSQLVLFPNCKPLYFAEEKQWIKLCWQQVLSPQHLYRYKANRDLTSGWAFLPLLPKCFRTPWFPVSTCFLKVTKAARLLSFLFSHTVLNRLGAAHVREERRSSNCFCCCLKTTIWLSVLSDKHFPSKLLLLIKAGFTIERQANSFSPVQWHGLSPVTAANHSSKGYDSCLCGCLFLAAIIKGQQRNKDRAHTRPS